MTKKQQILKAIDELPDDATEEDAIDKIYLLMKIHKGIEQVESGNFVTQEDAKKRMSSWLK